MATNADLERVKARAEEMEKMVADLHGQINMIRDAAVKQAGLGEEAKLAKENEALRQEINSLRTALVLAEIESGIRQVRMPTKGDLLALYPQMSSAKDKGSESKPKTEVAVNGEAVGKKTKQSEQPEAGGKKAKTEKKGKGGKGEGNEKPTKADAAAAVGGDSNEGPVDISRLDMRVGKIVDVEKHPDADSLYVEQVDLGEGRNRSIVSGLVKHVPINAMKDRIAVFMCNLKPAKMRGVTSEGMIMCASGPEKTEILVPPTDAVIGDRVCVEDYPGMPDVQLNPKKKIWETLKPDVRTNKDRVATYKGSPLVIPGKGAVVAPTLADAQIS